MKIIHRDFKYDNYFATIVSSKHDPHENKCVWQQWKGTFYMYIAVYLVIYIAGKWLTKVNHANTN